MRLLRQVVLGVFAFGCSRELEPPPEPLAFAEEEGSVPSEPHGARTAQRNDAPSVEGLAPRTPLVETSGPALLERVRRSGKKGVFVNVWATFCGPCKRELPLVQKLAPGLRARGIDVILVSVDEADDREKAKSFLVEHGITLPSYLAARPLGAFKQAMNPRWAGMVPASFLYDGTGQLRYYWGGEAFEEELGTVLDAFAAGKPIDGEADFIVAPGSATAR